MTFIDDGKRRSRFFRTVDMCMFVKCFVILTNVSDCTWIVHEGRDYRPHSQSDLGT